MAIKRKKIAKKKTKKKTKLVKSSRKKIKTKSKVRRKVSATKKRLNKSRKNNNIKSTNKKKRRKKMSAEAMKVSSVLDTSHLKVKFPFKAKYGNYINGKFVEPKSGKYFDNVSPISNEKICSVARSNEQDVEAALDAAHAAFPEWGKTDITTRSNLLYKIADVLEKNLNLLAVAECLDNGKPIRECMAADLPLVVDHWRYFAGVIRAEEGSIAEIANNQYSYNFHEPLGVVGQIVPWNFPLLMATWKLAPALAAGNCSVLKPAEQTPASIMVMMELIGDLLPPGVVNIVSGFGLEAGKPLASSKRVAKVAFTGETTTGRLIMQYAAQNIIPITLEIAKKTKDYFPKILVAGGLPPQDSTYKVDDRLEDEISIDFFNQAKILNPFVDFFYFDVLSSLKEIRIAIDSIQEFNKPYLIGAHISDGTKMPSGEPISELKGIFKNQKTLGVILSCISPENYDLNFDEIKNLGVPFGFKLNGYLKTAPLNINEKKNDYLQPNKFLGKRDDLSPAKMFEFVKKFKNEGATILGGCCETSPQHIKVFASLK